MSAYSVLVLVSLFSRPHNAFPTASGLGRFLPVGDNVKENFITCEGGWFDIFFLPRGLEQPLLTMNLLKPLKMKLTCFVQLCPRLWQYLPIAIPTCL